MKIIAAQKVSLTFASGDTVQNGTLSGFNDLDQTIPMSVSVAMDANSAQIAQCDFDVEVTSLTNVRATRGASGIACTVIVYVVQFPDATTVQKDTFSLGTGDSSTNVTIDSVTMAETFTLLFRKCDTASTLQPNASNIAAELTTSTNVAITKQAAGGAHNGHIYSVSDSDFSVQRGSTDGTTQPTAITISSITLGNAFCIGSHTSGETQYEDEGNGHLRINTSTALEFNVGYTSGTNTIKWQVVEDSDFTVQRAHTRNSSTGSGNETITSVDPDFTVIMPGHMPGRAASSLYNQTSDISARCTKYDLSSATNIAWTKEVNSGSIAFDVVEFAEYVPAGPTITDVGTDEDIYIGETGITITGTTFQTDGTNSRVRIDSSVAGTGTSQTQVDTSWTDTSIKFTASLGSLSYGTNYVFVRNQALQENATGFSINLYAPLSTSNMSDSTVYDGQTSVTVNGSGFGSSQYSSTLLLGSASDGSGTNVSQTITNWTDTAITFTVDIGTLSLGTAYFIVSRNNSTLGDSSARLTNAQTVTLETIPTVPVITNAEDENFIENETNVIIEGSGFGSSQGTGNCQLCPSITYSSGSAVTQTINTWANGELDIDIVRGALSLGFNYLFILNDDGYRNTTGYAVSLTAAASSDGLYKTSNIQSTVTSKGLTITTFLISDE